MIFKKTFGSSCETRGFILHGGWGVLGEQVGHYLRKCLWGISPSRGKPTPRMFPMAVCDEAQRNRCEIGPTSHLGAQVSRGAWGQTCWPTRTHGLKHPMRASSSMRLWAHNQLRPYEHSVRHLPPPLPLKFVCDYLCSQEVT